ncbi:hypothetical protein ACWDKQ_04965 [Saccharopolyspora sp. NPDC000995]
MIALLAASGIAIVAALGYGFLVGEPIGIPGSAVQFAPSPKD